MAISESRIEANLRDAVKAAGGWSIKMICTHISGLPDRLCLFPGGRVLFVELKAPGKTPRKIQAKIHDWLRRLGFEVQVIDSIEKAKNVKLW